MFCTHCGHELPPDAKFCTACGAEVKATAEEEKPQPIKSKKQEKESDVFEKQQKAPKNAAQKAWDDVVTLACFIALVVGGVGIIGVVVSAIISL